MSIIRNLYSSLRHAKDDAKASLVSLVLHREEINRYKDHRRIAIANQYPLSKEQKEQVDEFYLTNYGQKVDYVWHQNYAAHAGRFDYKFFPELLYIPEFEAYQNQNTDAVNLLSDKNFLPILAKGVGVKMPCTIVDCTNGVLRDGDSHIITPKMALEILSKRDCFFIKPSVNSGSGLGCLKVNNKAKTEFNGNSIIVEGVSYSQNYIIQEIIDCHESLQKLYPYAANSFRVITYLWYDKVYHMPIDLKVGRGGSYLDNAHAGGMMVAVDDNGVLCNHAVTELNEQYVDHPDTGIRFEGYCIEHFQNMIRDLIHFHEAIPQVGCINWDASIDRKGNTVVIEANTRFGSIWHPQMSHGVGPFGERTADVLQWLRFMKHLKPHDRLLYSAGKMG